MLIDKTCSISSVYSKSSASIHSGITHFPKSDPNCKPQRYLDMRETRYNTRNVNKSCLGTVEGIKDGVCVCVCIPDRENPPCPTPRQLSVLPRQWPCAWCHGPDGMPADPWAQESAWPQPTPFPLLTSIKAIISDREPYYTIWPQLASHTQTGREKERRRQHS